MDRDIREWVGTFREEWEDKPVEYLDRNGTWNTDSDPLFGSISAAIQSRDYTISRDELLRISRWKLQGGRNDHNVRKNETELVEQRSRYALVNSNEVTDAVTALTALSGVGVPMASTVLTFAKPSEYAIIDYRAFRGLVAVRPQLVDPSEYTDYAEFLDHFRTYLEKPESYAFYLKQVREIAKDEDLSAREVDMALWAYDNEKV